MSSAHLLRSTSIRDQEHRRPGDPVHFRSSEPSRQDVIGLVPVMDAMGVDRGKPLDDFRPANYRFPLYRGAIEAGETPRARRLVDTCASWLRAMVDL